MATAEALFRGNLPDPRTRSHRTWVRSARILVLVGFSVLMLLLLARLAVTRLTWFGPWIADTLRSFIGVSAVTALEERVASAEDRVRQLLSRGGAPREVDSLVNAQGMRFSINSPPRAHSQSVLPVVAVDTAVQQAARPAPFAPVSVPPMYERVAAPLDGTWSAIEDGQPDAVQYLTLLHPDPKRPYAELFVVAIDLSRAEIKPVAGLREPESLTGEARSYVRSGIVPPADQPLLLGAFNGGFKTVHGRFGMHLSGTTLVPPRSHACTVYGRADGSLAIGTWSRSETLEPEATWWRQAPPCLYEDGEMHSGLRHDETRSWGATLAGDTVIRRSAIGLDSTRSVLYVGVGNALTARAIARGMHHVGATNVAQLDVNWSYPKYAVFRHTDDGLQALSLLEGFLVQSDDYVRRPAQRDFFYVVRRTPRVGSNRY